MATANMRPIRTPFLALSRSLIKAPPDLPPKRMDVYRLRLHEIASFIYGDGTQ